MKIKIIKNILIILILELIINSQSFSQCGCLGAGLGGGLNQPVGTTNRGILPNYNFRTQILYKHRNGDEYYSNDTRIGKGFVNEFNSDYIGLLLGYGLTNDLTLEAEFGFFPNHKVDYYYQTISESGSPILYLSGKYNIYSSYFDKFEFTAGIGIKTAFKPFSYGFLIHSFIHKGFGENDFDAYLISRAEINTSDKDEFHQGHSIANSIYLAKNVFDGLLAIAEIRGEFAFKDIQSRRNLDSSGFFVMTIAPQIVYSFSDFYLAALYDIPVYRHFNGSQIAAKQSISISFGWQFDYRKLFKLND